MTWEDTIFLPTQSQFLPVKFSWEGTIEENAATATLIGGETLKNALSLHLACGQTQRPLPWAPPPAVSPGV